MGDGVAFLHLDGAQIIEANVGTLHAFRCVQCVASNICLEHA